MQILDTYMAFSSTAGATAAVMADQTPATRLQKFQYWLSGALVSSIASPSAADIAGLVSDHHRNAAALAVGLASSIVLKKVLLWLHDAELKDLLSWIIRK